MPSLKIGDIVDIIKLYQDYGVPYYTEGNNVGAGWVNIQCPWCDDPSNHLGYNLARDYFRCWRCGWRPAKNTLAMVLNVRISQASQIIREYGGGLHVPIEKETPVRIKPFKFPSNTGALKLRHYTYLSHRGFDPERVEQEWHLKATGPVSALDGIDYKHRIIAPIEWDGRTASFQARTIAHEAEPKYKACPRDREIIHHQDILYGKQEAWDKRRGICVEGITDVWRLGPLAFATFGIEVRTAQIREMAKHFERVFIVFDDEPQALDRAERLKAELQFRGVKATVVTISGGDPGAMTQDDADHFVRSLI
jgi:hypothetical protein